MACGMWRVWLNEVGQVTPFHIADSLSKLIFNERVATAQHNSTMKVESSSHEVISFN